MDDRELDLRLRNIEESLFRIEGTVEEFFGKKADEQGFIDTSSTMANKEEAGNEVPLKLEEDGVSSSSTKRRIKITSKDGEE